MTTKNTKLVLDCSITLPWYLEDEKTPFTEELLEQLSNIEFWVPGLWRLEFSNALIVAQQRGRISISTRQQCINHARQMPLNFEETLPSLTQIYSIATEYNLTTYDAVYLELAQRRGLTLATLDKALVKAAQKAKVKLITKNS